MSKKVIILRSVSGAGKTTFADYLSGLNPDSIIASSDDYFTEKYNGEYRWNAREMGAAHGYCRNKFVQALENNVSLVIVSNTNTKLSEFKFYLDEAAKYGYSVSSIILENRHGNSNVHNVPEEALNRKENNIRNSLKLR